MLRATPALMLIAASALLLPAESGAVTLFEPFTDGDLAGGSDNSGFTWYRRSSNQLISIPSDPDTVFGTGRALQLSISGSNQINRAVLGVFSPISLLSIGDSISLSFDFRLEALPTVSTADGFRFGLYNSNGTSITFNASTQSDDDFGYQVSIGTGTTPGFNIFKEENVGVGGVGSNDPSVDRTSITPTGVATFAVNDTFKHTGLFTITRTADGVSFAAYVDGTLLGTGSNTTQKFLTFDEVLFSHATPQAYRIDNVTVTTDVVPEPATSGLLGLGLAGLLARRRRR